jgi:hypothetical protein
VLGELESEKMKDFVLVAEVGNEKNRSTMPFSDVDVSTCVLHNLTTAVRSDSAFVENSTSSYGRPVCF